MQEAVERAWRRRHLVIAAEHLAFASGAVFCGIILMLLLGTDVLREEWLFLFAIIGLGITGWRVREQMIDRYRVAQLVDRKLSLSDALPTAWFLLQNPHNSEFPFAEAQVERAKNAIRDVNAASVFPFVWRRAWALTGALAAVAFGLFALRYLITDTLSLKQALIPFSLPLPAEVIERLERLIGRPGRAHAIGEGKKSDLLRVPGAKRDGGPEVDEKSFKQVLSQADAESRRTGSERPAATEGAPRQDGLSGSKQNDEQSPRDSKGPGDEKGAPNRSLQSDRSRDNAQEAKGQQSNASERPPGLMNRMKDALSGMMAKMRLQEVSGQKAGEQDRSGQNSKPGEGDAKSNSEAAQREASRSDAQKAQGQSREQAGVGQAQADASEKSTAQAHASDESANRKGSDAQSGVGRQDGDKAIKEAEQLRAMGKLDEIIGKRSASLTGDITVETNSAQQQLQTHYSGKTARHVDSGREIDRDEIPVALQKYVREYMEQVRKQADRQ